MKRDNLKRRLVTGALAGTMAISLGVVAFASDQTQDQTQDESAVVCESRPESSRKHGKKGPIEVKAIRQLVEDGKLSSETADSVEEYIKSKMQELKAENPEEGRRGKIEKHSIVDELLDAGIITEAEADVIKIAVEDLKAEFEEERYAKLEDSGLFSAEEIEAIKSYMKEKKEEWKVELEKIKDMTEEERKSYIEEHKDERKNLESEMVEVGIITEEQAKSLEELMGPGHASKGYKMHREKADNAVEKGL